MTQQEAERLQELKGIALESCMANGQFSYEDGLIGKELEEYLQLNIKRVEEIHIQED